MTCSGIEEVITSTIGNRVAAKTARGFESLPLRQKKHNTPFWGVVFFNSLRYNFSVHTDKLDLEQSKMIVVVETVILCIAFFLICFLGTGTDDKNLKSYSSYPDEVQNRIKNIAEYQGKFKEHNKAAVFLSNFLLFLLVLLMAGLFIREKSITHNFLYLSVIGQGLNVFDLLVIDLLWWRNTKRIRLTKIPEKALYQNPKKHIEAFARAFVMYLLIALIDGYILTLF